MKNQIRLVHIKHISICTGMTLPGGFALGPPLFQDNLTYGAQRALVWEMFQMAGMELTGGTGKSIG